MQTHSCGLFPCSASTDCVLNYAQTEVHLKCMMCVCLCMYLHLTHVLLFVCSSIPLFLCFFLCLSFSRARSLTRSLSVAEGTAFEARRSAESAIARASVLYRDTPRRGQAVGLETSLSVIRKLEGWWECLCVGPAWEIQFSTR